MDSGGGCLFSREKIETGLVLCGSRARSVLTSIFEQTRAVPERITGAERPGAVTLRHPEVAVSGSAAGRAALVSAWFALCFTLWMTGAGLVLEVIVTFIRAPLRVAAA